jgi:DNA topoisomerase-1
MDSTAVSAGCVTGRSPVAVNPVKVMSKNLVIVESPAKAKTIKKYLGKDFEVLASYGHVRDLVPKEGAVDPDHDFAMKYQLIDKNERHVEAIAKAAAKAEALYLATDPDREGEAISWHLSEILRQRRLLHDKPVRRVVFHEVTQRAIADAVAHPRDLSLDLVNAQQARRALDYLVGFNLSPLLWKKIRPGLSAGRVQSPRCGWSSSVRKRSNVSRRRNTGRWKQTPPKPANRCWLGCWNTLGKS